MGVCLSRDSEGSAHEDAAQLANCNNKNGGNGLEFWDVAFIVPDRNCSSTGGVNKQGYCV